MNGKAYFCILFLLASLLGTMVVVVNFSVCFNRAEQATDVMTISKIIANLIIGLSMLAVFNFIYTIYILIFGGISFSQYENSTWKLTRILSIANSLNLFPFGLILALALHRKNIRVSN